MSNNVIDYVRAAGDSFAERPATDVDLLVLAGVAYFEFENVPAFGEEDASIAIGDLGKYGTAKEDYLAHEGPESSLFPFFDAVTQSPRFASVRIERFECKVDDAEGMQYGACCFVLEGGSLVVAFRGTNYLWCGWREDFDMASKEATPGQLEALRYLAEAAAAYPHAHLLVCGHSKGGSFAEYATVFAESEVAQHIEHVASFDAPSLSRLGSSACPEFKGYDEALEKRYDSLAFPLQRYVFPLKVGLMLESRAAESFTFVKSCHEFLTHDVCYIEVEDGAFVTRIPSPKETRQGLALSRFVRKLSLEQRVWLAAFLVDALRGGGVNIRLGSPDAGKQAKDAVMGAYKNLGCEDKRIARPIMRAAMSTLL